MSHTHFTTSCRSFKHLTPIQRGQIQALLRLKVPKAHIAKQLGISRSTLYYELPRGTVEQLTTNRTVTHVYFADTGQLVYEQHRKNSCNPFKYARVQPFLDFVTEQILTNHLSPDAARGLALRQQLFDEVVSTKTIYQYITLQIIPVKNIDLPLRVRRRSTHTQGRTRRRIYGKSIDEREKEAADRKEFGHWEMDTIVGTRQKGSVLLVLDERTRRKRHMIKIAEKTAQAVKDGLQAILALYPAATKIFKSITVDNGSEFASLPEDFSDIAIYYAHPYAPYERGTNEKQNSLVRRFIPKGTNLDTVTPSAIANIEQWINQLPRKLFSYDCAESIFSSYLSQVS